MISHLLERLAFDWKSVTRVKYLIPIDFQLINSFYYFFLIQLLYGVGVLFAEMVTYRTFNWYFLCTKIPLKILAVNFIAKQQITYIAKKKTICDYKITLYTYNGGNNQNRAI